jgi:hypothetical protein
MPLEAVSVLWREPAFYSKLYRTLLGYEQPYCLIIAHYLKNPSQLLAALGGELVATSE